MPWLQTAPLRGYLDRGPPIFLLRTESSHVNSNTSPKARVRGHTRRSEARTGNIPREGKPQMLKYKKKKKGHKKDSPSVATSFNSVNPCMHTYSANKGEISRIYMTHWNISTWSGLDPNPRGKLQMKFRNLQLPEAIAYTSYVNHVVLTAAISGTVDRWLPLPLLSKPISKHKLAT